MGKLQCTKCRRVTNHDNYPFCEWCRDGFEKDKKVVEAMGGWREE